MDISNQQKTYDQLIEKLRGKKITIQRESAYRLCREIPGLYYPFPEDIAKFDENSDKYTIDEIHSMRKMSNAAIKAAKTDTSDHIEDTNIFQIRFYNSSYGVFEIPLTVIAKNYFLLYDKNIELFRRGLQNVDSVTALSVHDLLLDAIRSSVYDGLDLYVRLDPNRADEDEYEEYLNDFSLNTIAKFENQANRAAEIINVLKSFEKQSVDYENTDKDKMYKKYSNDPNLKFTKQIFLDLVSAEFKDKPVVKKAVSSYIAAQADKGLIEQINKTLEPYINNKENKSKISNDNFYMSFFSDIGVLLK